MVEAGRLKMPRLGARPADTLSGRLTAPDRAEALETD
jgi:hypothetical protein